MKKLLLAICTLCITNAFAQNTIKDLSSAKEIVWFGVNFADAKMIGAFDQGFGAGEASANSIKNRWIPEWNGLVVSEPKQFKIAEAFKKEDVYYDLASNEKLNANLNTEKLMSYNPYSFTDSKATTKDIVSKLDGIEKKEGIGVVFIVESFNKSKEEAVFYVTLFDIKTKNILVSEKIIAKPMGIGLRNFWAGAVKHAIKQIDKEYYYFWKNK